MTKLNKILIGALAVQVVLVAVTWITRDGSTIAQSEPIVAGFEPDAITRVEVFDRGDGDDEEETSPAVVVAKGEDGVHLESAHGYPAEEGSLDSLLSAVAAASSREPIATSEGRARQLEVARDGYSKKLVFHEEGGDTRTLYLGAPAGQGRVALRVEGERAIHAADSSLGRSAKPSNSEWAAQPYFEVQPDGIESLALENENVSATFRREGEGSWSLEEEGASLSPPEDEVLDEGAVDSLAQAISNVRLAAVAGSEPAPEHGLDEAQARVEIELAAEPEEGAEEEGEESAAMSKPGERHTLLLGDDADNQIHVRDTKQSFVVLVDKSSLDDLLEADTESLFATEEELEEEEDKAMGGRAPPGGMPGAARGRMPPGARGGAMPPPSP